MARNPAAQTAFGPMVLAAVEQHEPPGRRLVDDDLAAAFLPAQARLLVAASRPALVRRLFIAGMDRGGPGLWTNLAVASVTSPTSLAKHSKLSTQS